MFFLVIKGKILDVNWKPSESSGSSLPSYLMPRYIKVELRKIFKGVKSVAATKYQTILIRFASFDKPQFELGHLYVLSGYSFGTTLYMNSCSWSSKWKDLTIGQHFGISRSFYWIYCNCQITNCQTKTCKDDVRSCIWDPSDEKKRGFLSQDGICMVADGSRCKWKNFSLWTSAYELQPLNFRPWTSALELPPLNFRLWTSAFQKKPLNLTFSTSTFQRLYIKLLNNPHKKITIRILFIVVI